MQTYELIVIGSGPAGQRAAIQAAKLKKKVLVVERDALGGACLHTGTVPSKTLREAALATKAGAASGAIVLDAVMKRKNTVIAGEEAVIALQLRRNGVDYVQGQASFTGERGLAVRGAGGVQEYSAERFIVATGSRPLRPREIPFDDTVIFDSDSVLEMRGFPRRIAVLGAGVIGCEYASIFSRLGAEVTLVDRRTDPLRSIDTDIVQALCDHFKAGGMRLLFGAKFDKVRVTRSAGGAQADIEIEGQDESFDALLYCMGRQGNTEELMLDKAGIQASDRGIITVNALYQTSASHIYAVGDVIGPPALAASSGEQGRLAALHAFDPKHEANFPKTFPYGIYTIPEISSVGRQESELKEKKIDYVVGRALYRELARGKILGDEHGFLKILVARETREILGVHAIGTGATELIHIGQVAMALGGKIDFFVTNVFNYPTLAEAYKVAAYHAFNQLRSPA